MAKRQRDSAGMQPQRPRGNLPQRQQPRNESHQLFSSNGTHVHKRERATSERDPNVAAKQARLNNGQAKKTDIQVAQDARSHTSNGNGVRAASLLVQLLNEFANEKASLGELRSLAGDDVAEQVLRLHKTLKPCEKAIKQRLHQAPSIPQEGLPVATFPSKLAEAYDLTVPANAYTVPPLPEILDSSLSEIPFIHRSYYTNDHKKAVSGSYERLELLGDAYIEVIATRLLYPLYPDLPAGRLSSIREKLVCNETLATYSLAYGFAERAKVPDTYLEEGTSRAKIWTKLLGDFFEAYIAAVIISDPEKGFARAEDWMRRLWAPRLPDVDIVTDPDKGAKQELQRRLGGVGVRIVYECEREPEPYKGGTQWYIRCALTGWGFDNQLLGRFTGRSKQVAELGAAEEAMANPLTAQIQAIKTKYDEKVKKERADAVQLESAGEARQKVP